MKVKWLSQGFEYTSHDPAWVMRYIGSMFMSVPFDDAVELRVADGWGRTAIYPPYALAPRIVDTATQDTDRSR